MLDLRIITMPKSGMASSLCLGFTRNAKRKGGARSRETNGVTGFMSMNSSEVAPKSDEHLRNMPVLEDLEARRRNGVLWQPSCQLCRIHIDRFRMHPSPPDRRRDPVAGADQPVNHGGDAEGLRMGVELPEMQTADEARYRELLRKKYARRRGIDSVELSELREICARLDQSEIVSRRRISQAIDISNAARFPLH